MFTKIYNWMLYLYCWMEVTTSQLVDEAENYRNNHQWIKKNGPYRGE